MFFLLSKTAAFLLLPSNFLLLIGLVGLLLLFTRWRRAGTGLMAASLVLMALAAFLPFAALLEHPLESRFPPWNPARGAPDGIVVLGGGLSPALSRIYHAPQLNGSAERVTVIAKLARDYPQGPHHLFRRRRQPARKCRAAKPTTFIRCSTHSACRAAA